MNKYELMTIISTAATETARDKAIARVEEAISKSGGVLEKTDKWGVRKLAYPIEFRTDGFYVLYTFRAPATAIIEVERIIRITDGYVRFMTTRLDEVAIAKSDKRKASVKPRTRQAAPTDAPKKPFTPNPAAAPKPAVKAEKVEKTEKTEKAEKTKTE